MFTSTASADIAAVPAPADSSPFAGLALSGPTVIAGSLIGSAIAGRVMAWLSGGATIGQLVMLAVIAILALVAGYMANSTAADGTLDAKLAKLTLRASGVQTVLGIVTLTIAAL